MEAPPFSFAQTRSFRCDDMPSLSKLAFMGKLQKLLFIFVAEQLAFFFSNANINVTITLMLLH